MSNKRNSKREKSKMTKEEKAEREKGKQPRQRAQFERESAMQELVSATLSESERVQCQS